MAPMKVQDFTQEIKAVETEEKVKISELLERFDFESCNDRSKCKHYPLDMTCDNEEQINSVLKRMAFAFDNLLLKELRSAYVDHSRLEVKAQKFGSKGDSKRFKIGKIYAMPANRFDTVNTEMNSVHPFARAYLVDGVYEVLGEINFGIEIY